MEIDFKLTKDYIKLDDLLKYENLVDSGGHAKHLIKEGWVTVNGEVETRRGRKLRVGDVVSSDQTEPPAVITLVE